MHPAKWSFRHHEDEPPTTEVDIHKTLGEDLYIVLNGVRARSRSIANLKVVINPLVNWIWLGFLLLIFGTVIAFLPDRAYALAGGGGQVGQVEGGGGGDWRCCSCCSASSTCTRSGRWQQVQRADHAHAAQRSRARALR